MFRKLYAVLIATVACWILSGQGQLYAQQHQKNMGEIITHRWMLELSSMASPALNDSVAALISQATVGGILYSPEGSLLQVQDHITWAKSIFASQLLIGLDLKRASQFTYFQLGLTAPPLVIAATGDLALIKEAAKADARLLMEAGVDFVTLDPYTNSFGEGFGSSSERALELATTYMHGLIAGGVDVVGDFSGESSLAKLGVFAEEGFRGLNTTSLAGTSAEWENEYEVGDYLRRELEYNSFTFSLFPNGKLREKDLKKPMSDFVLITVDQAFAELSALPKSKVKEKRQQVVADRISNWKMERLLTRNRLSDVNNPTILASQTLLYQLNLQSATLLANADSLIPFRSLANRSFAASYFGDMEGSHGAEFMEHLQKYAPVTEFYYGANISAADFSTDRIAHFDNYIAAVDLLWFEQLGLAEQSKLLTFLLSLQQQRTNVILVLTGLSQKLEFFSPIHHISYHPVSGAQTGRLAPQLLFGAHAYTGNWPGPRTHFNPPAPAAALARLKYGEPWMRSGAGLHLIDSIAMEAVANHATPGCQVLVAKGGVVLYEKSFGHLTYDSLVQVSNETLYDLASLTKVSATLQALMLLVDQGKVDLGMKVGDYIAEAKGTNKENLLIRDVLLHQAGLQVHIPFWQYTYKNKRRKILDPMFYNAMGGEGFSMEILPGMYSTPAMKDSVWRWTLKSDLMRLGKGDSTYSYKYSDIGFIVIQKLVERVSERPLDELVSQELYRPLGMDRLCFQPLCNYPYGAIAPTELDVSFRKDMVWGTVHDQNAAIMGGVAGHAGLFGNANSLAILLQMHLQKGYYGGKQYLSNDVIDLFTTRLSANAPRALGWDMKDLTFTRNNTSFWSSETTYGHTGFTGTAVWVDPEMDLIYIFLSNRVHPDAGNVKLLETNVRTRIQDVIYQSLGWQLTSGD